MLIVRSAGKKVRPQYRSTSLKIIQNKFGLNQNLYYLWCKQKEKRIMKKLVFVLVLIVLASISPAPVQDVLLKVGAVLYVCLVAVIGFIVFVTVKHLRGVRI